MKAENIQSNTTAPFLAGRAFGTFHKEQASTITVRLVEDAKKIHTAQDLKDYCNGYKESLGGTGADAMTSMVRCILKVATGLDAKLCDYHKVKTPAQGQKVVKDKMAKGANGIDSLAKALRIPSAGKAEGDGESDAEPKTETGHVNKADEWWDACIKLGHSEKYGLTTDEMMARVAEIHAK